MDHNSSFWLRQGPAEIQSLGEKLFTAPTFIKHQKEIKYILCPLDSSYNEKIDRDNSSSDDMGQTRLIGPTGCMGTTGCMGMRQTGPIGKKGPEEFKCTNISLMIIIETPTHSQLQQKCEKLWSELEKENRNHFENKLGIIIKPKVTKHQTRTETPVKYQWSDEIVTFICKNNPDFDPKENTRIYDENHDIIIDIDDLLYDIPEVEIKEEIEYGPDMANFSLYIPWKWDEDTLFLTDEKIEEIVSYFL